MTTPIQRRLQQGQVIPACPLALNASRQWDEARQRGLIRYYRNSGAGGLAVGVHTTQFAIRQPKNALYEPLLALAADEWSRLDAGHPRPTIRVGGICGQAPQAVNEATLLRTHGFHTGLLSLSDLQDASEDQLIVHCRTVAEIIPLFGFYLQPAVGGRLLSHRFWRRFLEIENVVAIKIAAFNRYQTIDVMRASAESGREDVALYTGNDDNIILDLLTPYHFSVEGRPVVRRMVGGLLGQWAVGTKAAVALLAACHAAVQSGKVIPADLLRRNIELTDLNAALFDAAHGFAGCIAGIHEVLHRHGLLDGIWCLDPSETLSPGQREEIDRVLRAYPHLLD